MSGLYPSHPVPGTNARIGVRTPVAKYRRALERKKMEGQYGTGAANPRPSSYARSQCVEVTPGTYRIDPHHGFSLRAEIPYLEGRYDMHGLNVRELIEAVHEETGYSDLRTVEQVHDAMRVGSKRVHDFLQLVLRILGPGTIFTTGAETEPAQPELNQN